MCANQVTNWCHKCSDGLVIRGTGASCEGWLAGDQNAGDAEGGGAGDLIISIIDIKKLDLHFISLLQFKSILKYGGVS